jgi:hypothetical protein
MFTENTDLILVESIIERCMIVPKSEFKKQFPDGFKASKSGYNGSDGSSPRYYYCERGCDVRRGTLLNDTWEKVKGKLFDITAATTKLGGAGFAELKHTVKVSKTKVVDKVSLVIPKAMKPQKPKKVEKEIVEKPEELERVEEVAVDEPEELEGSDEEAADQPEEPDEVEDATPSSNDEDERRPKFSDDEVSVEAYSGGEDQSGSDNGSSSDDGDSAVSDSFDSEDENFSRKKQKYAKGRNVVTVKRRKIVSPRRFQRAKLLSFKLASRIIAKEDSMTAFQKASERLHVSAVPLSLPCREDEFATIYTQLESAIEEGEGTCIYISGVPGTGKLKLICRQDSHC